MKLKYFFVILLSLVTLHAHSASAINSRTRRADKNRDGVVDRKERKIQAQQNARIRTANQNRNTVVVVEPPAVSGRKVNTAVEHKYDFNADGWLNDDEIASMVKEKNEAKIVR